MTAVILSLLALWLLLLYPQILLCLVFIVCVVWFIALFPWLLLIIGAYIAFNLLMEM